jgi:hypothetical protein
MHLAHRGADSPQSAIPLRDLGAVLGGYSAVQAAIRASVVDLDGPPILTSPSGAYLPAEDDAGAFAEQAEALEARAAAIRVRGHAMRLRAELTTCGGGDAAAALRGELELIAARLEPAIARQARSRHLDARERQVGHDGAHLKARTSKRRARKHDSPEQQLLRALEGALRTVEGWAGAAPASWQAYVAASALCRAASQAGVAPIGAPTPPSPLALHEWTLLGEAGQAEALAGAREALTETVPAELLASVRAQLVGKSQRRGGAPAAAAGVAS